jgi:hypothetical protein
MVCEELGGPQSSLKTFAKPKRGLDQPIQVDKPQFCQFSSGFLNVRIGSLDKGLLHVDQPSDFMT